MATRYCLTLVFACLVLAILRGAPVVAQEGSAKEEAMEKIQTLLDGGEWKDAARALKLYKRKHADSDEEKEEASQLMDRANGFLKFEKIEADYRKKEKARKASKELTKLLGKYHHVPDLKEKASELLDAVRSTYVLVIEDFEDWEAEEGEDDGRISRKRAIVRDPKFVKHGEASCRWSAGRGWGYWRIDSPELDWTKYDLFCVWIYNEKLGKRPGRIEIEPRSGGWHYFQYYLAIDWVGWKEIRMPLRGRTSKFGRHGNPDWSSIETIDFDHDDDVGTSVNIIIDDIRLERAVK